jgi:hypothetical protein
MPDILSQDADVLSFQPGSPMLAPSPSVPAMAQPPAAAGGAAAPAPSPTPPNLQQQIQEDRAKSDAVIAAMEKSQGLEVGNLQQRQREMEPLRQRALSQAMQSPPQIPKQDKPPDRPKQRDQHDDENWLFAASILGSLAGAFTRNHATNALAAFSGAMQGYQEGSKQKFDQNMKIWEAENKAVQETNKQAMDEYRDILQNRKLSMDQMSVAMRLAGEKYDDQAAVQAAKTKNSLVMAQWYDKRAEAAMKMQQSSDALIERRDARVARDQAVKQAAMEDSARAYVSSPEGQTRIEQTMKLLRPPPSQSVPRNTAMGLREALIADELSARGLDFAAFKRNANVKNIEQTTPAMAERAGATSGARIQAGREAQLELIISTTDSLLPRAAASAAAIPATSFPRLNRLMSMADEEIGTPGLIRLKMDTLAVEEGWARAMNPTGQMTVNNVNRAHSVMGQAYTPETYIAALEELHGLLELEQKAIKRVRQHGELPPLDIPQLKSGSIGGAAGALAERAGTAVEQAGVPKGLGLPPGAAGRPSQSPRIPYSTPDMPIELPQGWSVKELQ